MAVFYETPRSRKCRREAASGSLTRSWYCQGVSDHNDVVALALLHNPVEFQGLTRQAVSADPVSTDIWAVEVEYAIGSTTPEGFTPENYSFRISAQTTHITQSLETLFRRQAEDGTAGGVGTAPDHGGAIGVTDDDVQGCDIRTPSLEWSKSVQRASVDHAYLRTVRNLVGRTNNAEFYGYPEGELLYLGCDPTTAQATLGDGTEVTVWNLTHSFAHEPLALNISIGDITVPRKEGHHYLWVRFDKAVNADKITRPPEAVYVERVYRPGNFALLEIGS